MYTYLSCDTYAWERPSNLNATYFEGRLLDSSLHILQIQQFQLLIFLKQYKMYLV